MFAFFSNKKTLVEQGVFSGLVDSHSHILPGVDDGVKTIKEALCILNDYARMGVKEVWLTPHIQEYMPNTTEELRDGFEQLKRVYKGPVELHLAAEYMIDNLFLERLENDDLLFHGVGERRLLVETSYFNPPMDFINTLRVIQQKEIVPILAHPERYTYMEKKDYDEIHSMGVLFQLNLPSLIGFYGRHAQKKSMELLEAGYYSVSGTDIHSQNLIASIQKTKVSSIKSKIPNQSL